MWTDYILWRWLRQLQRLLLWWQIWDKGRWGLLRFFFSFTYTCFPHVGLSLHPILIPSSWLIPQHVSLPCLLLSHVYRSYFDACTSYMLLTCLPFTHLLHAMCYNFNPPNKWTPVSKFKSSLSRQVHSKVSLLRVPDKESSIVLEGLSSQVEKQWRLSIKD